MPRHDDFRQAETGVQSIAARRHAAALPADAFAIIRQDEPSAPVTGGQGKAKAWTLRFAARAAPRVEPLMGWLESTDPLQQVNLRFPTAEAAIGYCRRHGLEFEVHAGAGTAPYGSDTAADPPSMSAAKRPEKLLAPLTPAEAEALYLSPQAIYRTPAAIVADPSLTTAQKRRILRSWEWDEYLLEVEATEAPVREHVSRLDEVRTALACLDARTSSPASLYQWEAAPAAHDASTAAPLQAE